MIGKINPKNSIIEADFVIIVQKYKNKMAH